MKRFQLIIYLVILTLSSMAQTIGEEMYIYRNNGIVNGFLPNEVQSIEFSYEDADGNTYDEIVTQIVNTADSIYMIPLAEIDSISFVTPKTEYQSGVINLSEQLMPYVISSTTNPFTITFSSSTPSELMPRIGDKLVTVEMNEKFPAGFAGEVTAVNGGMVTCQSVSLEEIFKNYRSVSSTYGYQEDTSNKTNSTRRGIESYGNKIFKLPKFEASENVELGLNLFGSDALALKGGTELSTSLTPTCHIISTLIINDVEGTYLSTCIKYDIALEEKVSVYGGIDWSKDFVEIDVFKAPVAPFVFFYLKPGLFIRANATLSTSAKWTQDYTLVGAFDFSTKKRNIIKPTCKGRLVSSSFDIEGSIDGSLAIGGFMEAGLDLIDSRLDNVCLRGELGAEMVGHAVLYNSDVATAKKETSVYERFKNSSIEINAFVSSSVEAKLGPWGISTSLPLDISHNIRTWDVVPTFSNTFFKKRRNQQNYADASVDMSGDCLMPVDVGLSVRKADGSEIASHYDPTMFTNGNKQMNYVFTNLSTSEEYTLYPKVKMFGYEMLASPSSDEENTETSVMITDFKQTGSSYQKNGYTYNGNEYSYEYDVAVTVELSNNEDIEDWGYVYEDLDHQTKRISLKGKVSPYTDTDYVFYRNEPISTATLYGYIKYEGDENYYYGQKGNYNLIYDKLPQPKTLDFTKVGETSATVKCGYQDVAPWGGTCGIEYWEDTHISNSKKIYFETAQDEIEISLTDLKPNTTYYYQSLVKVDDSYVGKVTGLEKNEILAEEIKSLTTKPLLTYATGGVQDKTASSATLTGTVENYDPADESVKFAFFYSTNSDVMNASDGKSVVAVYDNNGNMSAEISGLTDYTTYYYTLAIKRGESAFEPSEANTFTTLPVVSTVNNATTTSNSATLNGTCSKGITITGFSVKKDGTSDYTSYSATVDGNGNFSATVDGLESSTTYHYYAFIRDGEQTYLGEEYSFTTKERLVAITLGLDEIDDTKAYVKCNYIKPQDQYVWCGVEYWDETMEQPIMKERYFFNTEEEAIVLISNLKPKTKYYYRALISDGNEYIRADETRSFTTLNPLCPDDNHPHMIDLGLPSGTKWACCNVGADNPEGFGGYYAWGETEEKSRYDTNNYLLTYIDNESGIWRDPDTGNYFSIIDIGSDIAGTEYDVATVKWGSGWTMPSRQQIMELREYCEAAWGRGRRTMKFIGSNGNFIILPDAGNKTSSGTVTSFNGMGFYWSSSASLDDETYHQWAFILRFDHRPQIDKINMDSDRYNRSMGFSVRPVHK